MIQREVVVVAEHMAGELSDITLEMLAGAHELARSVGWHLTCLILADDPKPFEALPLAADKVVVIKDSSLGAPNPAAYARVLPHILKDLSARLVFLGNTSIGVDLAGPLSYALGAPAISGCVGIRAEGDRIVVTSRICGGKLVAQTEQGEGLAIVLVMPGSFHRELGMRDEVPPLEVRPVPTALDSLPVRFVELIEPKMEAVDVRKIPILVGIGRGVQSKDNLPSLEILAKELGGALCATRPVVDQGWLPRTRQVGRSGMTVKPRLYLALGVSGAPEHTEGMKESGLIVAVNKDPEAPIFDIAHYGATVDVLELVPILTEKIKEAKGSQ
ncbi:MAG TPA: electron transfer flavoprotein subunit alpha/FixB family protein [Thermoplasmata archaeon]|nr:electron transfer flavoprotein subunit alpha/FixB family protein [Thermoplasmata archaeon]